MFHSLTRRDKCLMNSRVCLSEEISRDHETNSAIVLLAA